MPEQTRGDRTRAAILEAAAEDLSAHGLDGMRGPRVAAAAEVSEATVWFHFGTKAGLLVAVMEAYYADLLERLTATIDGASSPAERLETFCRAWFTAIDADMALVGELGRQGRAGHDPAVTESFATCNRRVTRLFERLVEDNVAAGSLRDDLPPRLVRDTFFGAAEHVLLRRRATGRPADLEAAADGVLSLLLRGAGSSPSRSGRPDAAREDDIRTALLRIEQRLDAVAPQSGATSEATP